MISKCQTMKRIYLYLLPFLLLTVQLSGQPKTDLRSTQTKIADLLMQFPAQNGTQLNQSLSELSGLGEPGILLITSRIVAPGNGDDAARRDAISGLMKYTGKSNDKNKVRLASVAMTKAIARATNDEVKDFLLQELQWVAGNEAVPSVSKYLASPRLSDPAARVLVRVNTPAAGNVLLSALNSSKKAQTLTIVKALGDMTYSPAQKKLLQLTSGATDPDLRKVLLYSLARIGDPQSLPLLESAASKSAFKSGNENATGSYLLYLSNLLKSGRKNEVAGAAQRLLSNPSVPESFRSPALSLLSAALGSASLPQLFDALKSSDKKYEGTALASLANLYSPAISTELQKIGRESRNQDLIIGIITMMGQKKDAASIPFLKEYLQNKSDDVQTAAVQALASAGGEQAISPLIELMLKSDKNLIEKTASALQTIGGSRLADAAAAALPQSSGNARIALIGILANRQATSYSSLILAEAASKDPETRLAAAQALQSVVGKEDTERVAALLNKSDNAAETEALQMALFQTLNQGDKSQLVASVETLMKANPAGSTRYYDVLAMNGSKKALQKIVNEYETGKEEQQALAVKALTRWSNSDALDALFNIAKKTNNSSFREQALNSIIDGINKTKYPTDQKVLLFRKAMDLADKLSQKQNIINGISRNSTLLSLVFVAKYLDDPQLMPTAVWAVNNIILDNPGLNGEMVERIAQKSIELNKQPESEYAKQALLRHLAGLPKGPGFVSMFNGTDLSGWKGLVENPIARAKMSASELAAKQAKADEQMRRDWRVENGVLVFEGKGFDNLVSTKMYQDFDLVLDWRMEAKGDGGVYLRGSPQVQTWDTSRVEVGAQVGSGGLYNNKTHASNPLVVADNPINDWNTFRIRMVGDRVTVYLNGQLVTNQVILENYWDRKLPIFDKEAIELQAHGTRLEFRDVYVREIPRPEPYAVSEQEKKEGFVPLFNGKDLEGWTGNKNNYFASGGMIVCEPSSKSERGVNQNLYTEKEYSNFVMRFEFQLTPGANNGLGIRTPTEGDAAYAGMEIQILDNEAPIYKDLHEYQYHGSVYGVIPALRGYLKPVGEWNEEEVTANGNRITVKLNGKVILDGDIAVASKNNTQTADKKPHPGLLNKKGHIGFLGHGSALKFKNLRIKELGRDNRR